MNSDKVDMSMSNITTSSFIDLATINSATKSAYSHTYLEPIKHSDHDSSYSVIIPREADLLYNVWMEGIDTTDIERVDLSFNDLVVNRFTESALDFWHEFFGGDSSILPFFFSCDGLENLQPPLFKLRGLPLAALQYNEIKIHFELKSEKQFKVGIETGVVDNDTRAALKSLDCSFDMRCILIKNHKIDIPSFSSHINTNYDFGGPTQCIMFKPYNQDNKGIVVDRAKLLFEMATRFDLTGHALTKIIPSLHANRVPEKDGYHMYAFDTRVDLSKIASTSLYLDSKEFIDNIDVCSIVYITGYFKSGGFSMGF